MASCTSPKQHLLLCTCGKPYSLMHDLSLNISGAIGRRRALRCCICVLWTWGACLWPARSCGVRGKKLLSMWSKSVSLNKGKRAALCHTGIAQQFFLWLYKRLQFWCSCIQSISSHLYLRSSWFRRDWKYGPSELNACPLARVLTGCKLCIWSSGCAKITCWGFFLSF